MLKEGLTVPESAMAGGVPSIVDFTSIAQLAGF
jgi:hypothetical protein